jgi:hypothetical protein
MTHHPPVTDWVHDFDHTDPRWTENPFPIWDELRAECPVVHTNRFLGCYMPTTYEAVKQVSDGAADHVGPTRTQARQAIAAATVHPRRDEKAGAAGQIDLR